MQRVEKIVQVHEAPDDVVLLAISEKLTNAARRYDMQSGLVLESWTGLKQEIIKMFNHRIPFYTAMQRIEARKWNCFKESFDFWLDWCWEQWYVVNFKEGNPEDGNKAVIRG